MSNRSFGVRVAPLLLALTFILPSTSVFIGTTAAVSPPDEITIIQSPDASDSNAPVTIGTAVAYTITARDPDAPPVASLTFTIYWDYFDVDFSPGNRSLNDVVTAATNASGHATATVTHTYVDIGPHQQKDNNNDGIPDVGGWFIWLEVDDGVDGLGVWAAYSFMTLPLGNQPPIITLGLPSIRNTVVNPPNHTYTVTVRFNVSDPEGDHLNVTWDYGDGLRETMYVGPASLETTVSTTHTYDANVTLSPAYYNWTLRATVDDGHDHPVLVGPTLISMYVTFDSGPVFEGEITFTPTFGDPPYTYNGIALNFTVTGRDANGDPLYYSWDFNNDTAIDALGSSVSWILLDTGVHIPHPIYGATSNWSLHDVRAFVSDGYWKLPADAHNQSRNIAVWTRDNARPPVNDDFDNAIVVASLPFLYGEDTRQATVAPDDPYCFGRSATVWFSYRATEASVIEADTFGSNYDTTLSAYTGTQGNLFQVACNDDYSGPQSFISFYAMAGTTYHVMASAYGTEPGGDLAINIRSQALPPPPEVRFTLGEPSAVQQSFLAPNLLVIIPLRIEVMGSLVFPLYYDVRVYIDGSLNYTEPGVIFPGENMIVDRPIILLLGRAAEVAVEVTWSGQVVATGGPWTFPGYTATLRLQRGTVELGDGAVISLELRADLHIVLAARFDFTVIIDGRPSVESHFVTTSNQSRLQGSLCPPFLPCGGANATLYRYSWNLPLSRGQHTVRIEIRDVGLDHPVATAEFRVEVRNQFARRTSELQGALSDARRDLEGLEASLHPLGVDVNPLVGRLRAIEAAAGELAREVEALGPEAADVALEVRALGLEANALEGRAHSLSARNGYAAVGLWAAVLGGTGAGLGLAAWRRRRRGPL